MTDLTDQVLREIDKIDRVGIDGVRQRLTTGTVDESGARLPGLGLSSMQAEIILSFVDQLFGSGVVGMRTWFNVVPCRIQTMAVLKSVEIAPGYTLLDKLIDMPVTEDGFWSDGARPKNIGWALDDLAEILLPCKTEDGSV